MDRERDINRIETGGFLLNHPKFVAKAETASFGEGEPDWKAGTLPTELLPRNYESCELITKELIGQFIKSRASGTSPKTIEIERLTFDNFVGYPLSPERINAYLSSLTCWNAKYN